MVQVRRGLTLIETVLAATLLGLVAAGVFGAISSMVAGQERFQERLAAAELCNRLIIQYLDDKESMPNSGTSLAYADRRYRWSYKEEAVRIKLPERRASQGTGGAAPPTTQQRQQMLDGLKLVSVRVWLAEESGGSSDASGATPQFAMTRLISTVNFGRNPDSFENMLSTEAGRRQIIDQLMGAGGQFPFQRGEGGRGEGGGRRPGGTGGGPGGPGGPPPSGGGGGGGGGR